MIIQSLSTNINILNDTLIKAKRELKKAVRIYKNYISTPEADWTNAISTGSLKLWMDVVYYKYLVFQIEYLIKNPRKGSTNVCIFPK